MNLSQIRTRVKHFAGIQSDTIANEAINSIYRHIMDVVHGPVLVVMHSVALSAGDQTITISSHVSDFRGMKRVFYRSGTERIPVYLEASTEIFSSNASQGTPSKFRTYIDESSKAWVFEFDRPVSQSFVDDYTNIIWEYYYQPADLSSDSDEPVFNADDHQALVWGAVVLSTAKQGDVPGFSMFKDLWEDALFWMKEKVIRWDGAPIGTPGEEITEVGAKGPSDYGHY